MQDAKATVIPNFVTAGSPLGLRRAMLKNNLKKGFMFRYYDIQVVKGKWVAWYEEDITHPNSGLENDPLIKEIPKEEKDG